MQTMTSRFTLPAPEFEFAGFSWPRLVAALPYGTLQSRMLRRSVRTTSHYCHAPKPITGGEHPGRGGYHPNFPDRPFGLRWAWADEVLPHAIKHTGWYMDSEGYESIRGMILRLPRGRGWLAGASMDVGMMAECDGHIYDDERDAALAADDLARRIGELNRECEEEDADAGYDEGDDFDPDAFDAEV